MTGTRSAKGNAKLSKARSSEDAIDTAQIEYLLYQSTQGIHFMFRNADIAKILKCPTDKQEFFTTDNMEKVQTLLSEFLGCNEIQTKQNYLDRLPTGDFELLVRAYFQLVDNTILAHSNIRH